MRISRRGVLVAGAAVGAMPLSLWVEKTVGAAGPVTRPNASSAAGKEMLKTYARAVQIMMTEKEVGFPGSWTFQWYTHWVKGQSGSLSSKNAEIQRIYGSTASPYRSLAQAMWDTCQSHGGVDDRDDMFLPWHRMYVYYLEQIVRSVTGMKDFALPYWNYCNDAERAIPAEFRMPGDALFKSLYVDKRNPGVNAGNPIGTAQQLAPTALNKLQFENSGSTTGFSDDLNNGLHGNVHVLVGNGVNMGSVPWAAYDPIFWMHHCNIDRLWASWNRAGRSNPTDADWLNKSFTFAAPDGTSVTATVKDFISTEQQGYVYDAYQPVPDAAVASVASVASAPMLSATPVTARAASNGAVALGSKPTRVRLTATRSAPTAAFAVPAGGGRAQLVLSDLTAHAQPGIVYDVYLNLADGQDPKSAPDHYAGTINFFGAVHGGHGGHGSGSGAPRMPTVSLDVGDVLKRTGGTQDAPRVSIVPVGNPAAEAKPVIGHIKLIAG